MKQGGQSILLLTEKERVQEIKDWDMFDIPIQAGEDITNPIFRENIRDTNFRFFGADGSWRPEHFYQPVPRSFHLDTQKAELMTPTLLPQHMQTPFRDPFDRTPYNTLTDRDRRAASTDVDTLIRMGLIHPNVAEVLDAPQPIIRFNSACLRQATRV